MTQEEAEKATQFLVESAYPHGQSVALARLASNKLRHVKALAMKASGEKSAAAQEREAYASQEYRDALEEEFEATLEAEKSKAAREAAQVKVDLWRSISARQRGA